MGILDIIDQIMYR